MCKRIRIRWDCVKAYFCQQARQAFGFMNEGIVLVVAMNADNEDRKRKWAADNNFNPFYLQVSDA